MCDLTSFNRGLFFYPRREPVGIEEHGRRLSRSMRLRPVDSVPILDVHQQQSMREPFRSPLPNFDSDESKSDLLQASLPRASLWDSGSRAIAYPGADDHCWAFGGAQTPQRLKARSLGAFSQSQSLPRPSTTSHYVTTSMEYGQHWSAALRGDEQPRHFGTGSRSILSYPIMHQAAPLAGISP